MGHKEQYSPKSAMSEQKIEWVRESFSTSKLTKERKQ